MRFKTMLWSLLAVLACSLGSVGCSDDDDPVTPVDPTPGQKDPVLVVAQSVVEAAAQGGAYSMNFTLENAIAGQKVEASTSADWISGLETSATAVKFNVVANTAAAREAQITLKYKGAKDAQFTVKQASKDGGEPQPEGEGPKLDLRAHYETSQKMLCVDMACTSKDATAALFGVVLSSELDKLLEEGDTLDNIMDPAKGVTEEFDAELLGILNGEGFVNEPLIPWNAQIAGNAVAVLLKATNAQGSRIVRSDDTFEVGEKPVEGEGPQLDFVGEAKNGQVAFYAKSPSKNVDKGEILLASKGQFENALAEVGDSFENLADMMTGQGQPLNADWIDNINAEGLQLNLNEVDPSITYASMIMVFDAEMHRTVKYAVAEWEDAPAPQPQEGDLQVTLTVEGGADSFAVFTQCTSKNASDAYIAWNDPAKLDEMVAGGATLETIMDEVKKGGKAQQFDPAWIAEMNKEGVELTLQAEPKLSMGFLLDVNNDTSRVVKRADATTIESVVKVLDTESFRKLVWDYKTNASWKYEGELPCVIDFFATWCGPCKAFAPTFHKLASEYEGSIVFYQVDVDQNSEVFAKMAQMGGNTKGGIPFFCFAGMEGMPNFKVGGANEASFRKLLDKYCLGSKTAAPFKAAYVLNAKMGVADVQLPEVALVSASNISLPRFKVNSIK